MVSYDRDPRESAAVELSTADALHRLAVPLHGRHLDAELPGKLEQLRERFGSIAPVEIADGVAVWLLLSYELNYDVLTDQYGGFAPDGRRFRRDARCWREMVEGRATADNTPGPFADFENALGRDAPEHHWYRAVIEDALSVVSAQVRHRVVREIVDGLVAEVAPAGRADIVADFAFQLPLLLLGRLFGLPPDQSAGLVQAMRQVWDGGEEGIQGQIQLFAQAQQVAAQRRADPGSDIVSRMVTHEHGLNDQQVAHQLILLISAAHDPMQNLITNTVHRLLTDEQLRWEMAGSRTLVSDVVHDVLWRWPPLETLPGRFPIRDTPLGDAWVRAGDCLVVGYGPAARDPVVAQHLGRAGSSRAHLAWGAGDHQCPAREMAHDIVVHAVERLFQSLPDLQLDPDGELSWRRSMFAHALTTLPVTFTPVPAQEEGVPCPSSPSPSSSPPETTSASSQTGSARPGRWRGWWSRIWRLGR